VTKAIARIQRADLAVVDLCRHRLAARRAGRRRSVAVSSNLHPSGFDELMPKTLASATVDRLMHHAHVCQTSGDSIRRTACGWAEPVDDGVDHERTSLRRTRR
jgi:IstB-like ATP binding protein